MTAAIMSPHDRLPMIEPDAATLQSTILEALNRRRTGTLTLAGALAEHERADVWIELAAGDSILHLAPLLAGGAVPMLVDGAGRPDAAPAAVVLGITEPLIAAIELVIGRPLRPIRLVDAPAMGSLLLRVEAQDDDLPVHALLLAIPADAKIAPVGRLPLDPAAAIEAWPHWVARLAGPMVPLTSLARIGRGDMLLLGTSIAPLRFIPPGRDTLMAGRLDVEGGRIVVEDDLGPAGVALDPERQEVADTGAVSVPTTIEIDGGGLTLDRLAALGVGSVIALPAAAGGMLPVRLTAGGKLIASGELVAVGDGYGMLVTAAARTLAARD